MEHRIRLALLTHGLVAIMLGVLSGAVLAFVMTGDMAGDARAWHQAHLQGIMSGLLTCAAGWFSKHLRLGSGALRVMALAFVVQAYGFSAGTVAGALTGHRGLQAAMPIGNMAVYIAYTAASLGSIIGVGIALYGAIRAGCGELKR